MSKKIFQKVTSKELDEILKLVSEWWKTAPSKHMFNDCKRITRLSVAEYLANLKGLTLWERKK